MVSFATKNTDAERHIVLNSHLHNTITSVGWQKQTCNDISQNSIDSTTKKRFADLSERQIHCKHSTFHLKSTQFVIIIIIKLFLNSFIIWKNYFKRSQLCLAMNTRKRNRKPSEERCQITPYSASKISKIDKVTNTDASVAGEYNILFQCINTCSMQLKYYFIDD